MLEEASVNEPPKPSSNQSAPQQPKRTAYLQNYEAVIAVASGKLDIISFAFDFKSTNKRDVHII